LIFANYQQSMSSFIVVIFHEGRLPFFSFTSAGYVVVAAQDMWWGKSKIKLTQPSWSWNWG
jgi:hypothetical protein